MSNGPGDMGGRRGPLMPRPSASVNIGDHGARPTSLKTVPFPPNHSGYRPAPCAAERRSPNQRIEPFEPVAEWNPAATGPRASTEPHNHGCINAVVRNVPGSACAIHKSSQKLEGGHGELCVAVADTSNDEELKRKSHPTATRTKARQLL